VQYFTRDEAKRIINNTPMSLCFFSSRNPNLDAMRGLAEMTGNNPFRDAYFTACMGFILGRATGIREERARRRAESNRR